MTQDQATRFAREYLWNRYCFKDQELQTYDQGGINVEFHGAIEDYKLHPSLQFHLCKSFDRLDTTFDEITTKDIALLVEAWILGHLNVTETATSQGERKLYESSKGQAYQRFIGRHPLVHKDEPPVPQPEPQRPVKLDQPPSKPEEPTSST